MLVSLSEGECVHDLARRDPLRCASSPSSGGPSGAGPSGGGRSAPTRWTSAVPFLDGCSPRPGLSVGGVCPSGKHTPRSRAASTVTGTGCGGDMAMGDRSNEQKRCRMRTAFACGCRPTRAPTGWFSPRAVHRWILLPMAPTTGESCPGLEGSPPVRAGASLCTGASL